MLLKDRIKQAASIDAGGAIVFGAALADHEAVVLPPDNEAFSYLLEDGSGGFELGSCIATWTGTVHEIFRYVRKSNVGGGLGFAVSTTGLTLSIVQTAAMSVAAYDDEGTGPRTAGVWSMAVGPRAEALHEYSTAIGPISRTMYPGEVALGFSQDSYPSWLVVGGGVLPDDVGVSLYGFSLSTGMIYDKGLLRVTGTITAFDEDDENAAKVQVFDVSMLLVDLNGAITALGTPTFTTMVPGSGITGVTLAFGLDGGVGAIYASNSGTSNVFLRGLLHLQWVTAGDWW